MLSGAPELRERALSQKMQTAREEALADCSENDEMNEDEKKNKENIDLLSPTTSKIRSQTSLLMVDMERYMRGESVEQERKRKKEEVRNIF